MILSLIPAFWVAKTISYQMKWNLLSDFYRSGRSSLRGCPSPADTGPAPPILIGGIAAVVISLKPLNLKRKRFVQNFFLT
jgi:hypothetical protein